MRIHFRPPARPWFAQARASVRPHFHDYFCCRFRILRQLISCHSCRTRNRSNGATQTFRRQSLATAPSSGRESNHAGPANVPTLATTYIPPHLNANHQSSSLRNGLTGEVRYTKDQLLALYKYQRRAGALDAHLADIFTGDWDPFQGRESHNPAWGRREEGKDPNVGPEICWDRHAAAEPLALIQLSDEEREVRIAHKFLWSSLY
jgi:PERQ amino acid-rich with GYF domain-containing protein